MKRKRKMLTVHHRPCSRKHLDPQPCSPLFVKRGVWWTELRAREAWQTISDKPDRLDGRDPVESQESRI